MQTTNVIHLRSTIDLRVGDIVDFGSDGRLFGESVIGMPETLKDVSGYRAVIVDPVRGDYVTETAEYGREVHTLTGANITVAIVADYRSGACRFLGTLDRVRVSETTDRPIRVRRMTDPTPIGVWLDRMVGANRRVSMGDSPKAVAPDPAKVSA